MNRLALLTGIIGITFFSCSKQKEDTQTATADPVEAKVDSVLSKMSQQEKIGQLAQRGTPSSGVPGLDSATVQAIREGRIGSFLNVMDTEVRDGLQRVAIEESPNGIPLIFGRDVIHGFKTIFPIPLGQAATWNPEIVELGSAVAAREARTYGVDWTFAPMVDIARDPRWGRIAESCGEDPYLASTLGAAMVRGFQGDDMSGAEAIAACTKHYAGYGAAEGGRDYNTAVISEELLRNVYLKPFKACKDAGTATYMASFNEINGVPSSGNPFLLKQVLRDEWGFDGFVVSDWNSIGEMIPHGYCTGPEEAALKAFNAGLDMEMMSTTYEDFVDSLIKQGKIEQETLDNAVRNILRVKFRLGLFDNPYITASKEDVILREDHLEAAKEAAVQSAVMLKNNNNILPLGDDIKTVAVIGPLANAPHEQMGTWVFDGEKQHCITPLKAFESLENITVNYSPGLEVSRTKTNEGFAAAHSAASQSDVILFFGGEESILSGEAHSRANINLPGAQEKLIKELKKTGKPIVLVVMAGRPITLSNIIDDVDAVLFAWHPGTMAGPALTDLITGIRSPSGRLPVTFPKVVGQIPVHYNHKNTGRPAVEGQWTHIDSIPVEARQSSLGNRSHYLDEGYTPHFPFGYGLTYSSFEYSDMKLSSQELKMDGKDELSITVKVTNTGNVKAVEVVQLYVQDEFASITRPVRELKGFERIELEPGTSQTVEFILTSKDLEFFNGREWVMEPGTFNVWVAPDAQSGLQGKFTGIN